MARARSGPRSPEDQRRIVRDGYDRVSVAYRDDAGTTDGPWRHLIEDVLDHVEPGAPVLDLGCGAGVPFTRALAERFRVTGVDLSPVQVARARTLVPRATIVEADMAAVSFPPGSFAAVVALYSIIHVPLGDQPELFARIAGWLRRGGVLVAVVGRDAWSGVEKSWHGAEMAWSHADESTYVRWIEAAGLQVERRRFIPEGDDGHVHVVAMRPSTPRRAR
jgi:SAM-dependent methyltransferase